MWTRAAAPAVWAIDGNDGCAAFAYAMKNRTLAVRLPEDLRQQLEELSASKSRPVSDLVRESIQRYVSIQKFRSLRRAVLPCAEAKGLLTDKDVFDSIS